MSVALKRGALYLVAAGYGLGFGVAIAFALMLIAGISLIALYGVVAAALAFELSRFLRRKRGGVDGVESDQLSDIKQTRVSLPILLFLACVVGGLIAFSIDAVRGTADRTSVALLVGISVGAGVPTAVDLALARRGE